MGDDEQVKAFNDMAHLLGFKTGFRMPLSAGQLRVQGRNFSWDEHEKAFIDACVWGIELGLIPYILTAGKHIFDMIITAEHGEVPGQRTDGLYNLPYQAANRKKTISLL